MTIWSVIVTFEAANLQAARWMRRELEAALNDDPDHPFSVGDIAEVMPLVTHVEYDEA